MKNILSILSLTLILVSCGQDKAGKKLDLESIKAERSKLVTQQQELVASIKAIDLKIEELSPAKKLPLITTFTAKSEKFEHFLELQGNVATKQNLVVTPEMAGILKQVFVKEGQQVSKGQLLARIDDGGLSSQVAQLQIQADFAKTTYDKQKRLWDQKIGSEIQYLQAKSAYEAQQKAIAQLNSTLAKTAVRAPFSGVIDDIITEQGNVVAPGQTQLMRIVNLKDMYISVDVPERYISNVTKNKAVQVNLPVLGETLEAYIRQTGNFINPANRTFNIEIAVPNKKGNIKPNLTAKLKINDYTNEKAILIPQNIISENANGEQYVYILEDKTDSIATAKRVIIETGKTQGDVIEVLSGILNNTEIVQEGARSVKDGQKVKLID